MATQPPTTLMTGATGFLGNFVLRDLLLQGRRIAAILRPPLADSLQRLRTRLAPLGVQLDDYIAKDRFVPVAGMLPDQLPDANDLGVIDILSCAASLQLFRNGDGEPFLTNIEGTQNLLDWADRHGVRRFHAVSTAYVCGSNTDDVRERFHDPEPQFHTDYERSKWQAEQRLHKWSQQPDRVLTVYRPSFLVGDSQTGYTTQFGGFYLFARVVSMLKEEYRNVDAEGTSNGSRTHINLRIPGWPDDPQNFVPVDFASRMIAKIMADESFHGRIYHLTDPAPPTNDDVKRFLEDYFLMEGGYFAPPDEVVADPSPAEQMMWAQFEHGTTRVTHNPRFVPENSQAVMNATGIEFPVLNRERFTLLLDYAIACRWGKHANGKVPVGA